MTDNRAGELVTKKVDNTDVVTLSKNGEKAPQEPQEVSTNPPQTKPIFVSSHPAIAKDFMARCYGPKEK